MFNKEISQKQQVLAIDRREKEVSFVGTPLYVAPEMLDGCKSGFFSDFWALGNVIFEMSAGYPPFRGRNNTAIFNNIGGGKIEYP